MKTKFILHGGRLKYDNQGNDSYFEEVLKVFDDGDKLLFIGWARRNEEARAEVYKREKGYFLSRTDKDVEVVYATYENLIDEIKNAKAIASVI